MQISLAYLFHFCQGGMMGFYHAELYEALLNSLSSSCCALPSKRLKSYIQQPGDLIMLYFQDRSTATCDILLGADGVKSAIHKTMLYKAATRAESQHQNADAINLRSLSELQFSGFFTYRTLIPTERLSSISSQHRALSSGVQVSCSLPCPEYQMLSFTVCST
jgi:salicylate hydroxylase